MLPCNHSLICWFKINLEFGFSDTLFKCCKQSSNWLLLPLHPPSHPSLQGSILSTTWVRKFFCFLAKFFVFWKFLQIFYAVLLSKIYIKHSQEYAPASSTKTSAQNIFLFLKKKIWGFKMIWLFTKNIF